MVLTSFIITFTFSVTFAELYIVAVSSFRALRHHRAGAGGAQWRDRAEDGVSGGPCRAGRVHQGGLGPLLLPGHQADLWILMELMDLLVEQLLTGPRLDTPPFPTIQQILMYPVKQHCDKTTDLMHFDWLSAKTRVMTDRSKKKKKIKKTSTFLKCQVFFSVQLLDGGRESAIRAISAGL